MKLEGFRVISKTLILIMLIKIITIGIQTQGYSTSTLSLIRMTHPKPIYDSLGIVINIFNTNKIENQNG